MLKDTRPLKISSRTIHCLHLLSFIGQQYKNIVDITSTRINTNAIKEYYDDAFRLAYTIKESISLIDPVCEKNI